MKKTQKFNWLSHFKKEIVIKYLIHVLAFLVLQPSILLASPITITFEGTINKHPAETWVEQGFAIGQNFVGEYTFESTTPSNPYATNFGGIPVERMPYPNALLSFTVTSGGNTFTSSGSLQNGILIDNNLYGKDDYFVVLSSLQSELYIDLRSTNLGLFTSLALPSTIPLCQCLMILRFFAYAALEWHTHKET